MLSSIFDTIGTYQQKNLALDLFPISGNILQALPNKFSIWKLIYAEPLWY